MHRSELDDVARFGFAIASVVEDEDYDPAALDVAPNDGYWTYRLVHRPPLRLIIGGVYGTPSRPVAGKPFVVNVPIRRSDTSRGLTSGVVTCDIAAAGRKIRASGAITAGTARCSVVVPRDAVGIRGTVVVRAAGKTARAWFAGAVDFGGGPG